MHFILKAETDSSSRCAVKAYNCEMAREDWQESKQKQAYLFISSYYPFNCVYSAGLQQLLL